MKYDVVALGELLVDFTPSGYSQQGNPLYEANPGGAPCNVLAMLQKLGNKTAIIGKIGNDLHGRFLYRAVQSVGIDTSCLAVSSEQDTTLAFVALRDDGDRDFAFIRRAGADTALLPQEVSEKIIADAKIFHFGSLSLTHEPSLAATKQAVSYAKKHGCLITFDPNMRELLWESLEEAKLQMLWGCSQCSVIKLAMEELFFLTETDVLPEGVSVLKQNFPNLRLILVTHGAYGSHAFLAEHHTFCTAFRQVNTIDTTGAGDTFMGYCLHFLLEKGMDTLQLHPQELQNMLMQANAAAALITTRKGALCNMPCGEDIRRLIAQQS